MLSRLQGIGLWTKVKWREHQERQAERRVQLQDPPGVTVPAWLVRAAHFASWVAMASLVYFLWLYTLDIARDRAGAMHITHAGTWIGDIQFWFPYIAGFAIVSFGIPYTAKIAIPTFMSLSWRGAFWPKLWALIIAVAVSTVVIFGTFVLQGDTLLERDRESAVAVEQVQMGHATLAAQIADVQHQMDERTRSESVYVRTAASMSPEAYDRFVEARRNDWQYERLRSYRAVSEEMARLNQEMSTLRQQQAQQTAVASVQAEVTTERTSWIADAIARIEGIRAIVLSFVMDIVALMMPWIALRLEQARNRQLGMADGIALHPFMINDKRAEGNVARERQRQDARDVAEAVLAEGGDPRWAADMARAATAPHGANTRVTDAETGEELVQVKPHWRKLKRRQVQQVETPPGEIDVTYDGKTFRTSGSKHDDSAAPVDGARREASTAAKEQRVGPDITERLGAMDAEHGEANDAEADDRRENKDAHRAENETNQPEPPSEELPPLSDEEDAAIEAELAADEPDEPQAEHDQTGRADASEETEEAGNHEVVADHIDLPNNEGILQQDEPQHDAHVRARALLTAAE